ncbi:Hypothetical protein A7982_09979 [Minicystis rosea]|nr:Hypothetical protein A7982_09979 [Minicystis rosea]
MLLRSASCDDPPRMPDASPPADEALCENGIDAATGQPAFAPLSVAEIAARAREELLGPASANAFSPNVDPHRPGEGVEEYGWAVVIPVGLDPAIRRAIEALCARRKAQAGPLYQELDFDPRTDDFRRWLSRHKVSPGNTNFDRVPRYVLLLGPPDLIPFSFQYLLGIEYGVGRLVFDTPAEYAAYAESVVLYETTATAITTREACFWGPRRDPATELSSVDLLAPLIHGWGRSETAANVERFRTAALLAESATRQNLLDTLHRTTSLPPTLLFTASHGAVWPSGHERQATEQGSLLAQDWFPGEIVERPHRVAASDIEDGARVHGLVAFLFACFSAGTPSLDSFPKSRADPLRALAPAPFFSALPRRLLAHPRGGALGVFGHVDRAWGFSMRRADDIPQIDPFRNGLLRVLRGAPLGDVLSDFGRRCAVLSANLLSSLDRGAAPLSDADLARTWIERNDAQGYVLLGDPGTRTRKEAVA